MKTSFDIVKTLTNSVLRNLMKELKEMSNLEAPAKAKKSPIMKELFESEKTKDNYWSDQYHSVDNSLRLEIVNRFLNL